MTYHHQAEKHPSEKKGLVGKEQRHRQEKMDSLKTQLNDIPLLKTETALKGEPSKAAAPTASQANSVILPMAVHMGAKNPFKKWLRKCKKRKEKLCPFFNRVISLFKLEKRD